MKKMKPRIVSLLLLFSIFAAAGLILMLSTNAALDRNARFSYNQSFQLLASTMYNYLDDIQLTTAERNQNLQVIADNLSRNERASFPDYIVAVWRIDPGITSRLAGQQIAESNILDLYRQNMTGRETSILILIQQKIYHLINCRRGRSDFLFLIKDSGISVQRLQQILSALMQNSDLRYFAILDHEQNPILYETCFENYLPILGTGSNTVMTPAGPMLQIEETNGDRTLIVGFDISATARAKRTVLFFVTTILTASAVLTSLLIAHQVNFARFRLHKEREITGLQELAALSAGFTHEFKNSLQSLTLLGQRLKAQDREIIESEINRMNAVIRSFALLARSDIAPVSVNLKNIVDEATTVINAKPPALTVTNLIAPDIHVAGDKTMLTLTFNNLLRNSLEAGARYVSIVAERRHDNIVIDYRDDGPGIAPDLRIRLFEPFFSRKQQTGLGLYLVKKILLRHGGDIQLKSGPGSGVHFCITLKENR